jgi:ketosteroid isomerase-like protein
VTTVRLALPFLSAVLVAAGPAPELSLVDAEWDAAVAAKDQAGFLSRVPPDALFSAGVLQVGRDAIREKWAGYFEPAGPSLRWKPTAAGMAGSGDLGFTVGDYRFEWKARGVAPSEGRYVTVWAKDASGRWMAALDSSLEPASPLPATRKAIRTIASRDGSMEASIGTWERGEGPGRRTGTFLVIREKAGGGWRVLQDSEVPAPGPG